MVGMDLYLRLIKVVWVLCLLLLASSKVCVAGAETATVVLPLPMVVDVNGVKLYGDRLSVSVGSTVCLTQTVVYTSAEARMRFRFWTRDSVVVSTDPCVRVDALGVFTAVYASEYLVVVTSEPRLFTYSEWVEHSGIFRFTAPRELRVENISYVFSGWSGDAVGVEEEVEVAVARPTRLVASYTPMYPLYISDRLVGYFPSGYVYLYSPDAVEVGGVKKAVSSVTVVGSTYTLLPSGEYAVTVSGPTYIHPVYRTYYKVVLETPHGTQTVWVEEGSTYTISPPTTISLGDVTYLFKRLVGNVVSDTVPITVVVDRPINVTAVYTKMYKVTVVSPTGEKVRYVEEGGDLYIYEPEHLSGIVLTRTLKYFLVDGAVMKPQHPGILIVKGVSRPITVVAVYEVGVVWTHLLGLAVVLAALVISYGVAQRFAKAKKDDGYHQRVGKEGVGEQQPG
ncbi:MAG: hypothetical protein QW584_02820 [Thermofilaceae archaeon]